MVVLLKDEDQELDYAQKFLCTLYSMTNGLVEEQRNILDVLEYASIRSRLLLAEKEERELADRLVQFLKMKCNPARVEIVRNDAEISLTSAGLEWCEARCVKHVWRHNSEISLNCDLSIGCKGVCQRFRSIGGGRYSVYKLGFKRCSECGALDDRQECHSSYYHY